MLPIHCPIIFVSFPVSIFFLKVGLLWACLPMND